MRRQVKSSIHKFPFFFISPGRHASIRILFETCHCLILILLLPWQEEKYLSFIFEVIGINKISDGSIQQKKMGFAAVVSDVYL
jgi:hypothetical protein